jgi:hypothetical protein
VVNTATLSLAILLTPHGRPIHLRVASPSPTRTYTSLREIYRRGHLCNLGDDADSRFAVDRCASVWRVRRSRECTRRCATYDTAALYRSKTAGKRKHRPTANRWSNTPAYGPLHCRRGELSRHAASEAPPSMDHGPKGHALLPAVPSMCSHRPCTMAVDVGRMDRTLERANDR